MGKPTMNWLRCKWLRWYYFPLFVFFIGIVASIISFFLMRDVDSKRLRTEFKEKAEQRFAGLRREIDLDLEVLVSIQAFYSASGKVKRSDFQHFVEPLLLRHPDIQAFEWIPRIHSTQREVYEKTARQEGFPTFQITEKDIRGKMVRSLKRDRYFPVLFVEPYKGNEIALGYDLGSDQTRMKALEQSRDSGEMLATARIRLVQETADQFGFLVFAPVYRKGAPTDSIESRRQNLEGFILGVFRIGDIVEESLAYLHPEDIKLSLYDQTTRENENVLLYPFRISKATSAMGDTENTPKTDIQYAKELHIAGRRWLVLITPSSQFFSSKRTWHPWEILIGGLLFTAMVGSYLLMNLAKKTKLSIANKRLKQEIAERKRAEEALRGSEETARALLNATTDSVFLMDRSETILALNEMAARRLNRRVDEMVGACLYDFLPPDLARARKIHFDEVFDTGKPAYFEDERQGIYFDNCIYPISDIDGKVMKIAVYGREVTEKKRAEETLRAEKQRFQTLTENAPFGMMMIGEDGTFRYINPKFIELFGYNLEDVPDGKTWFRKAFPDPAYRDEIIAAWRKYFETDKLGEKRPRVFTITCKDGTEKISNLTPARLESGENLMAFEDITEREKTEQALSESERRYRNLVENAPDVIFTLSADGTITSLNPAFETITGWSRREWLHKHFASILHPEDLSRGIEVFQHILEGNKTTAFELSLLGKSGDYLTAEFTITPQIQDGSITHILGLARDITERKRAENALRESEEKYRTILQSIEEGYYEVDLSGHFTFFNDSLCRMLGYSRDELMGMNNRQYTDQEGSKRLYQTFNSVYRTGEPAKALDHEIVRKDGTKGFAEASVTLMKDSAGQVCGFRGISRDISEHKQLERKILQSKRNLEAIFDGIEDQLSVQTPDYEILRVNRAVLTKTHSSYKELIGRKCYEAYYKRSDPCKECPIPKSIQTKQSASSTMKIPEDGTTLRTFSYPILDESGEISSLIVHIQDITEEEQLQEQLIQSEKLAGIGILASGVAHEINNPLSGINVMAEAALEEEDIPTLRGYLTDITNCSQRIGEIVAGLRSYSRTAKQNERSLIDMSNVLEDSLKMVQLGGKTRPVQVVRKFQPLQKVEANLGEMQQVFTNLITNAFHAMNGKEGILTLSTQPLKDFVEVKVSDNGVGIPEKHIKKIFDPFFTTKKMGEGTGLGLNIVYRIVAKYDGTINVESKEGVGTTFKLQFPIGGMKHEQESIGH